MYLEQPLRQLPLRAHFARAQLSHRIVYLAVRADGHAARVQRDKLLIGQERLTGAFAGVRIGNRLGSDEYNCRIRCSCRIDAASVSSLWGQSSIVSSTEPPESRQTCAPFETSLRHRPCRSPRPATISRSHRAAARRQQLLEPSSVTSMAGVASMAAFRRWWRRGGHGSLDMADATLQPAHFLVRFALAHYLGIGIGSIALERGLMGGTRSGGRFRIGGIGPRCSLRGSSAGERSPQCNSNTLVHGSLGSYRRSAHAQAAALGATPLGHQNIRKRAKDGRGGPERTAAPTTTRKKCGRYPEQARRRKGR